VPSLALGSGLVTPLELTAAYAVFPNGGYRIKPRGLVSVTNASGARVLQNHMERNRSFRRRCRSRWCRCCVT
jgi:membrane carboxypeptidase/penicillin-binding protein